MVEKNLVDLTEEVHQDLLNESFNLDENDEVVLSDGTRVDDLRELISVLKGVEDQVFLEHVSGDRNDFSVWLNDFFDKEELAGKVEDVGDPVSMARIISAHMSRDSLKNNK